MPRKIFSITGTRADYGLMRPVYDAINKSTDLELYLVVTGMHFLPEFKESLDKLRVENIGQRIELSVFDRLSTSGSMASTLGAHIQALVPVLEDVKPDIVLLQGDRGEMLAGAIAAAHMNIPVVHMSGGDKSGTIDDSIRHAITKFSHVHLPTCEESRDNLLAMGEEERRIRVVGEPALDIIKSFKPLSRGELAQRFPFLDFSEPFLIVAQHSVTNEAEQAGEHMQTTLEALVMTGFKAIITAPNSDAGSTKITEQIDLFVEKYPNQLFFVPHLGQENFYSLMSYAAILIGNSSSGILEAPSFKLPVINIGSRQHERLRAENVLDVPHDKAQISETIIKSLSDVEFKRKVQYSKNPYGDGDTSSKTVDVLRSIKIESALLSKWIKGFSPL